MVETLAMDRNGGASTLFAFTRGRGVWRVRLGGRNPGCTYALNAPGVLFPAAGATFPIEVKTQDGCAWSAVSGNSWTRLASPSGGRGSGVVTLLTTVNPDLAPLSGVVAVADQSFAARQEAAAGPSGNDEISTAAVISRVPYIARLNSTGASASSADPVHSCTQSRDAKTLWFQFVATSNGTVAALAGGPVTNIGTVLTAYPFDGRLGAELGCDRQATGASQIRFAVTAGRTYVIELSSPILSSSGGDTLLEVF
jgi:hypothetical protein